TLMKMFRVYLWGRFRSPEKVERLYFRAKVMTYPLQTFRDVWIEIKRAARTAWATIRDVTSPFNLEWKHKRYDKVKPPRALALLPEETYRELDMPYVPKMKKMDAAMSAPESMEPRQEKRP